MHRSRVPASLQEKKKKYEPPAPPPRVGKKQRKRDGAAAGLGKIPNITPNARCKLRLLKLERVKDYLLMEEEWVKNQELLKPHEERNEEDRTKVAAWGGGMRAWTHVHGTHGFMHVAAWHARNSVRACKGAR